MTCKDISISTLFPQIVKCLRGEVCPKLLDEAAELCLLGSLVLPRRGLEGGGAVHEGLRQVLLALQVNVDPVRQTRGCKGKCITK